MSPGMTRAAWGGLRINLAHRNAGMHGFCLGRVRDGSGNIMPPWSVPSLKAQAHLSDGEKQATVTFIARQCGMCRWGAGVGK